MLKSSTIFKVIFLFKLEFAEDWDQNFKKFDATEKTQVWKKILQVKEAQNARHLKHGLSFFVLEAGQYRICFEEEGETRQIIFVGNHKQYEKWYKNQ